MDLTVEDVDRHTIKLPFRSVAKRNMDRMLPHWRYFDLFEVELACGAQGYGEDMLYYGWGTVEPDDINRSIGQHAVELLFDDTIGSLQIALFDAVGTALGVPVYELVGTPRRTEVPLGWWCIDMPGEDWLCECELAIARGYTAAKIKGRPWQDIRADIATLCSILPNWFTIGIDFNGTLLDAERALPILEELTGYSQVKTIETPVPHEDVDGHRRIARSLDANVAVHNGRGVAELTQVQTGFAESYVLGTGGPDQLTREAGFAEFSGIPFWIQNLGILTARFWAHVGATMPYNTLPNVFCDHLFAESPITIDLTVDGGTVTLGDLPGLGVGLDRAIIEKFQVDRPTEQPSPDRLIRTTWPGREPMYFSTGRQLQEMARTGRLPYFESGVSTELVPNDGSDIWRRVHNNALEEPVVGEIDGLPSGQS